MKNNYTSLKSPLDEEDELKTDHEIDLEKGLLPEYNSEEEGALPPYSDISKLANPVPEDSSTGPTEIANPNVERRQEFKDSHPNIYFLLRLLISVLAVSVVFFTAWVCVNPLEKSIFGKVAFSVTIGITCPILFIAIFYFYETWTKACGKGIKHFLKKWRNMFFTFCKSPIFCLVLLKAENKLSSHLGDQQWGWKCSASAFTFMAVSSILIFIAETVEPGSCSTDLVKRVQAYCDYEARQYASSNTAIPLREMNPENEA
ncbi:wtf antidote-like meiotic drive suppressor Wtf20 [Schizosaccharomyces pombe]|uniref:Meiotic drive suppressor wtf20 n=1 Tax=Schizosaccharomyces pombe (strain 972 / ATCC 24843) TaxID=284812 RepID=WTF20_SCHPO|nr:wtf element Wtf20 [Schizosaccharomyces pombe]O74487.1 RecName: Full=Meiotic drive suppressor wtf20 [Schizosaccharomyces pombe 972h-]CAA20773.1 wtf element Wtf20 [Schizosaccharomyces pombe]|eukprot:NP_588408.1 wtf element Wtf20 [Schizosaccharomyces pombe]